MTETEDVTTGTGEADAKAHEAVIDEALRLIDTGLSDLMHRELVSTDDTLTKGLRRLQLSLRDCTSVLDESAEEITALKSALGG